VSNFKIFQDKEHHHQNMGRWPDCIYNFGGKTYWRLRRWGVD